MARKRAVGEGSVSYRKDGRWEAAVMCETTAGVRKRIRKYAATHKEAVQMRDQLLAQARQGLPVSDKNWKLGDYLDYWLEHVVKPTKQFSTYSQCERMARRYLKPSLGNRRLMDLTVPLIQGYVNQQLAAGCKVPTMQAAKKVLSAALTNAMREEFVSRNPARLVVLPTYDTNEYEPWSSEEAQRFLEAAQGEQLYPAFLLLLLNGLRRGEVLGLVWRDVDFVQEMLHVRQQLQRSPRGLELGPLKTRASRRDLALLPEVMAALRLHQDRQLAEQRTAGAMWRVPAGLDGLVFPAEHGKPMESSTLGRAFNRVCRENGIRHVRIHDARDGLATLLDDLDVPVKQTQAILGHSRITTTLEHYIHPRVTKQRAIMEQVGAKLLPQKEKGDTDSCRLDKLGDQAGSRQVCRQSSGFGLFDGVLFSGAGDGTLTRGLVLGNCAISTVQSRWTEVQAALRCRTRLQLLGTVAVDSSRQKSAARMATFGRTALAHTARVDGRVVIPSKTSHMRAGAEAP